MMPSNRSGRGCSRLSALALGLSLLGTPVWSGMPTPASPATPGQASPAQSSNAGQAGQASQAHQTPAVKLPFDAGKYQSMALIAATSLTHNLHQLPSGTYVSAGAGHFDSLWVRDFCFASRGLLAIGLNDVVRDQLDLLLGHLRPADGMVPRSLDSVPFAWRYVTGIFHRPAPMKEPLKATYTGGSGTHSTIDSNALLLLAALDYVQATGDHAWWQRNEPALVKVFRYYDTFRERGEQPGLIVQGDYSDWQDSVQRHGKTFFTNLVFYTAAERLKSFPAFAVDQADLASFKQQIINTFAMPKMGLFRSIAGAPFVSIDGLLLAIDLDFFPPGSAEAAALYEALKRHPLWTTGNGFPGVCTMPTYPGKMVGTHARLVGLTDYHGSTISWSWLSALAAKTAWRMGDQESADRILDTFQGMAIRDGMIREIYRGKPPFTPWASPLYRSEIHFSWGAGMVLDCLRYRAFHAPTSTP